MQAMKKLKITEMERLTTEAFRRETKLPIVVVLDDVRSMNNVGSVFRTADAFRLEGLVLCGITARPPHPDIHKTALGAEDSVAWTYAADSVEAVRELRAAGYEVLALEQAHDSVSLEAFVPQPGVRYALVLGNEALPECQRRSRYRPLAARCAFAPHTQPMSHDATPLVETTEDGSLTLFAPTFGEHYHSTHGAVQESLHIYIGMALEERLRAERGATEPLRLFEVGFGTGLNALLTWQRAEAERTPIHYYSIEKYPVGPEVYEALHYEGVTGPLDPAEALGALHTAPWGEAVALSPFFTIEKLHGDLTECTFPEGLSVIYYDAFSPESQPELWAEELFARLFAVALPEAVLTTYCAKGEVRRRLQRAGFLVERLPGPPGKREVLRARVPR